MAAFAIDRCQFHSSQQVGRAITRFSFATRMFEYVLENHLRLTNFFFFFFFFFIFDGRLDFSSGKSERRLSPRHLFVHRCGLAR